MIKFCKKCDCETIRADNGRCKPCRQASRDKWRAANLDKIRVSGAEWRVANRKKCRESNAKWRNNNPGIQAKWRAANPEKVKGYKAKWLSANREKRREYEVKYKAIHNNKIREYKAKWYSVNLESYRIYSHNRRARAISAGGELSLDIADRRFKLQRGKCACGCKQPLGDDYHRDHIMPLALGGSNTDDNIQLLRAECNLKKGAKHPVEFMRQSGYLL